MKADEFIPVLGKVGRQPLSAGYNGKVIRRRSRVRDLPVSEGSERTIYLSMAIDRSFNMGYTLMFGE
jgi:hypothetical protein